MTKLNKQHQLFVEAFCSSATFNASEAARNAGYSETSCGLQGYKLLQKPYIQKAINRRLDKKKAAFWIKEDIILERLWNEATKEGVGTSHAGRINALVWLGKHLGMWQERIPVSEESNVTYNIINYSDDGELKEKIVNKIEENKEEINKTLEDNNNIEDNNNLPEGVVLLDFKNEEKG